MFVQNLNQVQQGVMLSLANKLISIDGEISEEELAMIAILETQCDEDVSMVDNVSIPTLKDIFQTEREKASVILELLAIAYADGDYHASEQVLLKEITEGINLNKSKLTDMEIWVKRQLILASESKSFMED